ncbi:Asp-tRNA(Asn)/Glu-tRNA(Gln) amidotransferase subunit GatA [Pseudodesulfovibrio sp. JC047]|uniref:Asp-tRNA(Asn)/Glu-tRNA(Gln) amidotransferase subunit GatA n=1 Tax=Pseudodesulfovibrio sp. JC047 TaxID=2683199 RepID=UPI0013D42549|nr:Asp-tRNA(Asn)/Glu-tRNA(Gln) amidotransferase subunit GatA [Pseudodesulfovibrio sp. JC047]NDV18008.1 Asp-tRNA(Asn)/Glu-tRNA(Gln) amidotransferase subunit GatA [Pseudodesulfovibrio sp. JC047]
MSDLYKKTLSEVAAQLQSGELKAVEAVRNCLDRIEATEPRVKALITVTGDTALAQAETLDAEGPDASKPLWGVPIVLKDLLATKGIRTTCASKILDNFVPFYDATAVVKLREAGAIIIGKANMDEFAMGSSTENSAFFQTGNPWDTDRVPGGSSGGSGATVAAGQCYAALGTDTGGSIRLPASFCGIVGLKPTYGRISRFGLIAYGSSLDQIGPMTRSVEDAARMLQVMAGHDPRDSTSVDVEVPDYLAALGRENLDGVTIGLPEEYWGEGLDAEVEEACRAAVARMESLGAKTVPVKLSLTEYAIATYYIIAMAEASSNLSRFDGVRFGHRNKDASELIDMYTTSRTEGFGDEVQRRIIMGTYVLSSGYYDAYYNKAAKVRRLLREDFDAAFEQCDLIAGPVCPTTAFKAGEKADPLQMYLMDIFTISANLAGLPGMSLPVGLGKDSGMPVGLQFMGPAFGEADMLSVTECLERNLDPMPMPEL